MKIGIVTFHRAHNCGAALQCVALVTVLKRMGHEVKVVDCNDIGDGLKIHLGGFNSLRGLLSCIKMILCAWCNVHRWRYRNFMKRSLPLTRRFTKEAPPLDFDCYILGSDQVLNPSLISGWEKVFLLLNLPPDAKRIAYAASFGIKTLPFSCRSEFAEALKRFYRLSFRETSALDICRSELGIDAKMSVVLDPTLLLDAEDYIPLERKVRVGGDYVLVYTVGGDMAAVNELANRIAARRGMKVVFATLIFQNPESHWLPVSPDELLYLARNASCVVTTSFHGTAFSIINQKPFLTVIPDGQKVSGRITDLLQRLDLSRQIVHGERTLDDVLLDDLLKVDYSLVMPKLDLLRKQSMDFLTEALNEAS